MEKIGIVAHDAGGAEIISSYIRQNDLACNYTLAGPAIKIFEQKLGPITNMPLEELVEKSEQVLCGTSSISRLEWSALQLAKLAKKKSVAVLDHWVNYRGRFVRDKITHLPDEIWVGDEQAQILARKTFPDVKIKYVENAYFSEIKQQLDVVTRFKSKNKTGVTILFVCEPVREGALIRYNNERYWGYTEEEALRYFLNNIERLTNNLEKVIIRPHPREEQDKYKWALREYELPLVTGVDSPLFDQIVESDIVVGCASMAMIIALLAKKRVISCVPPGGRIVELPLKGIEKF